MVTDLSRQELRRASVGRPTALTIGVFDGVHLGHQAVLRHVTESAEALAMAAAAVTFHPHPRQVLRPEAKLQYLTSLEDRLRLLLETGLDSVAQVTFTSELAQTDAPDFVRLLVEEMQLGRLIIGEDFALGRQRGGDVETLTQLGVALGFSVEVIELVEDSAGKVSSTDVRGALDEGAMARVQALLGRRFSVHGPVVLGFERGKSIGFPTANVAVGNDRALPATGVYCTLAHLPGGIAPSVTNIGVRPTFDDGSVVSVECHILDFDGDLYGMDLRVEFVERLRGEQKFDGVEALAAQIQHDCEAAREVFAR